MRRFITLLLPVLALLALGACSPGGETEGTAGGDGRVRLSSGQSYAEFGKFVVHVNAMNSTRLEPDIATKYGITRSEDLGLVNLVVLRKTAELGTDRPVRADVELVATNLTGQVKNVDLREVEDGASIYYIGLVSVENRENVNFDFDIRPEGTDRTLRARFSHEFFTR